MLHVIELNYPFLETKTPIILDMDSVTTLLRHIDLRSFVGGFASCHGQFGMKEQAANDRFAIHIAVSGQAAIEVEGGRCSRVAGGDALLIRGGSSIRVVDTVGRTCQDINHLVEAADDAFRMHVGSPHQSADADFLVFCGSVSFSRSGTHPLFRHLPPSLHITSSPKQPVQSALVQCLSAMYHNPDDFEAVQVAYLMQAWFVEALTSLIRSQPTGMGWISGLADTRLLQALNAIHDRPGKAWTTDWLADIAGLSRSRFAKVFTDTVGEPPLRYLNRWRVECGCQMMMDGTTVTEVAQAMGFANASVFSRVFRRYHRKSPLEWLLDERKAVATS